MPVSVGMEMLFVTTSSRESRFGLHDSRALVSERGHPRGQGEQRQTVPVTRETAKKASVIWSMEYRNANSPGFFYLFMCEIKYLPVS